MEKTTKKKKTKRLRKRIGIIAVGGLSLVLTVCLSVGATLAWFAGSSWASKSLFMGGPVYVEMAGRGTSSGTDGTGSAQWKGGDGSLDIKAAASRTTGTVTSDSSTPISDEVLLPGQKVAIYSQARVFSTAETTTVNPGAITNDSSGATTGNTSNTNDGYVTYTDSTGRVTTATTSVLRARFSINVEFDPSVGFNNFTDQEYMENYPQQSKDYTGKNSSASTTWETALATSATAEASRRRDEVVDATFTNATEDDGGDLTALHNRTKKSIYSWQYVSESVYKDTSLTAATLPSTKGTQKYVKMPAPFNGETAASGSANGFYGVWILDDTGTAIAESDAFFKARTNSYLKSYVEYYVNEYGNVVKRTLASSVESLDTELNRYFVNLVNDSSNNIIAGNTAGFTVDSEGDMTHQSGGTAHNASWLYIDPKIGNDTNTNEISTTTGGWWYLVACNQGAVGTDKNNKAGLTGTNKVEVVTETINKSGATYTYTTATGDSGKGRNDSGFTATNDAVGGRLDAKLYEIKPDIATSTIVGRNYNSGGTYETVRKVVSSAFPFVNGTFALPGDALTNVFANAKISFQISFQALQAFFPFTESIDNISYTNALLGTAKALTIRNAIPIYNEAFDYTETVDSSNIDGL